MGCSAIFAIPSAGFSFFFSSWIVMVFWGIVAPWVGIDTLSYVNAMVVTIGAWLAIAPLVGAVGGRRWRQR